MKKLLNNINRFKIRYSAVAILMFVLFFGVVLNVWAATIPCSDCDLKTGINRTNCLLICQGVPTEKGFQLQFIVNLIQDIGKYAIILSITIAIVYIIWGGIMYMASGSDEKKQGGAKTRIKNGIIGAVIVLGVGVLLRTIATFLTKGEI